MSDRRRWAAIAAAAVVLLAAGIIAIAATSDGGDDTETPKPGTAPETGTIEAGESPPSPSPPRVRRIPVGGNPDSIAAGGEFVWVADSLRGTVRRIHPEGDRPIPVEAAGFPTDVAADESGAWLALPDRGAVQRLSPDAPPGPPVQTRGFPFRLALGESGLWAMSQKAVERLDPATGDAGGDPIMLAGGGAAAIAAGEGWVWVVRARGDVLQIDPDSGRPRPEPGASLPGVFEVATGEGAAWALETRGTLDRIDPGSGDARSSPARLRGGRDVAAGLGYVWVASREGVIRFDPIRLKAVGKPIPVGRRPHAIAVGGGSVWVASAGDGAVYRIDP